ncbi:MAG: GvpL/GvpF family gas vesicle protein [Acidobacteriia bacterium]|nr:GvpL/GvpF family gas vesicle protein [Terriglobia bacterium]
MAEQDITERNISERAYYLYCLTPSGRALELNEAGVFVWACDGICAVLSESNREEFCGEGSEARLEDLAWLAPRVFRHEAVVERIMGQSPVLPARFATLFSSLESLRSFVLEYHDAITGFFAQVGDKREWAVKGLLDRPLVGQSAQPPRPQLADTPGKNYLQKKRMEAEAGELTNQWVRAVCQKAAGELEQQASAFRERQLWNGSDSNEPAEVILNWAFLVPGDGEADFRRLVTELDERHRAGGLSFALSGPWPPYSFAPALGGEKTA